MYTKIVGAFFIGIMSVSVVGILSVLLLLGEIIL